MSIKDGIINKEKVVQRVDKPEDVHLLINEKNSVILLDILQQGPMTFEDIRDEFKKKDIEKSDKTIYGYLNRLKKANLVMEAGKRVITYDDNHIKTLTLYSRTAKIFYIGQKVDRNSKRFNEFNEIILKIINELPKIPKVKLDQLHSFLELKSEKDQEIFEFINEHVDPESITLLQDYDARSTRYVLDHINWIVFLLSNLELIEETLSAKK
ncbi:MAG: hypothetical protein U9O98_09390 [Asgard group archaeon]|nr:hypothetical protein [Asgard group archaeon]